MENGWDWPADGFAIATTFRLVTPPGLAVRLNFCCPSLPARLLQQLGFGLEIWTDAGLEDVADVLDPTLTTRRLAETGTPLRVTFPHLLRTAQ